jgi:pilus assembly protein Flp/PilA
MDSPPKGPCRTTSCILSDLAHDESGQDLIEYALVAALVALGAVASMRGLGNKIASAFGSVTDSLSTAI